MSWKHFALAFTLIASSSSALARHNENNYSNIVENPWVAAIKFFSQGNSIGNTVKPGMRLSLAYIETPHWYTNGKLYFLENSTYNIGITQGFTFSEGDFSPYLEVTLDKYLNRDTGNSTYFEYDAGTYYKISDTLFPFIELDNFVNNDKFVAYLGLKVAWTSHISTTFSGAWKTATGGDAFDVTFAYRF